MGIGRAQSTVPGTNTKIFITRALQTGILRSVSAIISSGTPGPTDASGIIFLGTLPASNSNILIAFESGFITANNPLSWHGEYKIEGYEIAGVSIRSNVEISVFLTINVDIG